MLRHWDLSRDPFADGTSTYVPVSPHEEAVERLADAVATRQRRVRLVGPPGSGKTVVLDEALARLRGPLLRVARVARPVDGPSMLSALADLVGQRAGAGAPRSRGDAWRALADACRLCRAQGIGVLLAVDDAGPLDDPADRRDLDRLEHADPDPEARLTVVEVGLREGRSTGRSIAVAVSALTRSEADAYLDWKLRSAGRVDRLFTPRAVARLHARAVGVPRDLDRLATRALWEGQARGVHVLGPELVDSI